MFCIDLPSCSPCLASSPWPLPREEQALALDPLSAEICMRLAFFLVANQQLAQARPLYEKALVIAPSSDRALFNLGELELLDISPNGRWPSFVERHCHPSV